MGDFTGFTFGGHNTADLGITRVSGGDRYDEELHPEIKDRTAEVPGLNGEYYFGSDYGTKTFDIDIAFDHLTEEQFRKLRQVFGTKKIQKLIFDERPYKYYMAKIESPIELSYVCFDEEDYTWEKIQTEYNEYVQGVSGDFEYKKYNGKFRRIYKGEGKISLVCYFPFAKSAFKVLPEEDSDWAVSSGILSSDEYGQYDTVENGEIKIYNPGDLPTGFRLYCPFTAASQPSTEEVEPDSQQVEPALSTYDITLAYTIDGTLIHSIKIKGLQKIGNDEGFLINTDNGLIQGVSDFSYTWPGNVSYNTTGNIYNRYVTAGHFFKLEPNSEVSSEAKILISDTSITPQIFYDYLYF